jgi:hypothetical protein
MKELKQFLKTNGPFMVELRKDGLYLLIHHWKYLNPRAAKRVLLLSGKFDRTKRMKELKTDIVYISHVNDL